MFGIDYLLSPVKFDYFRQHHYGKSGLLISGSDDKFKDLLGWEEINQLSRYGSSDRNSAKLILNKKVLAPEQMQNFDYWIREGATFAVNHLQGKDPLINKFVRILSAELNTTVNVNCYVSAPCKQGFDKHFDRHDVFVVHLEGQKKWYVYKSSPGPRTLPLEPMKSSRGEPPDSEPYIECVMGPGDVLYIPRGHWHYAVPETPCIHLTVGPQSRTPIEFLGWHLNRLMWNDEFFRHDFPIAEAGEFGGRRSDDELKHCIRDFQERFSQMIQSEELEQSIHEYIMLSNPLGPMANTTFPEQQTISQDINEDTELTMPIGQKVIMKFDPGNERASVQVRGLQVDLDHIQRHHLQAIFREGTISGRSIMESCPDVSWEDIKKTLLIFLDRGVLMLIGKYYPLNT